jgi:hypothetical protein
MNGQYRLDNPPELVQRFTKICDEFKKMTNKSKEGIANHDLYFNILNSLEVWGDDNLPSYSIKGVGQVNRGLAGPLFEIDPIKLSRLEKQFGLNGNPSKESLTKHVFSQLYINLAMNNSIESSDNKFYQNSLKMSKIKAKEFVEYLRIAPGLSPANVSAKYNPETKSLEVKSRVEYFKDINEFRSHLSNHILNNNLSVFDVSDKLVPEFIQKTLLKINWMGHEIDQFMQRENKIEIDINVDSGLVDIGDINNLYFSVNSNHPIIEISKNMNELNERHQSNEYSSPTL